MLERHGILIRSLKDVDASSNQVSCSVRRVEPEIKVNIVFFLADSFPDDPELHPMLYAVFDSHREFLVLNDQRAVSTQFKVVKIVP